MFSWSVVKRILKIGICTYLAQSGIELKYLRLSSFSAINYLILIHYSFFVLSFCKTVVHCVQANCHCSYYLRRRLASKGIVTLGVMPHACVCVRLAAYITYQLLAVSVSAAKVMRCIQCSVALVASSPTYHLQAGSHHIQAGQIEWCSDSNS